MRATALHAGYVPAARLAPSHHHGLGPARLALGEIIAQRDGGLRWRDLAAAATRLRQPEQIVQRAARAAMQDDRAAGRGELGESAAARDVIGPSADACRRLALFPKLPHVQFLPSAALALPHGQPAAPRLDPHLRETELRCRFEILCQHVVSPLTSHLIYTRSRGCREWALRCGCRGRALQGCVAANPTVVAAQRRRGYGRKIGRKIGRKLGSKSTLTATW